MRPQPLRYVTAPDGTKVSLHKCGCRAIVPVAREGITTCRCGRRYARHPGGRQTRRQVVIREQP